MLNRLNRRQVLTAAVAGATPFVLPAAASAQANPVKIVVGFAPGGSADSLARLVADLMQGPLGRPVIVENRAGAAGRLAIEQVKNAPADGSMLLLVPHGPVTLFPHVFKTLRFDMARDFVPITRVATADYALTVGPMVPAKDLKGFIAWAKTPGDKVSFGSPGNGTIPHLLGVAMGKEMGIRWTHVPYRGVALAMNDLAGGVIAAVVSPLTEALELHKAGRVHIVATTGATRSPFSPDVPTLKESGIGLDVPGWFAIYAPSNTPADMLERYRATLTSALAAPSSRERFARLGMVPAPNTPAEQIALQQSETKMWGPVVQASGFTPEE